MTQYRHKRRGTVYEVITDMASIQCGSDRSVEEQFADENWTVYRSVDTGATYVRLTEEFQDGRFELIAEQD